MDDLLPSDVAFTTFLQSVTAARARRDIRPPFTGWELARYRTFKPPRKQSLNSFNPTPEQIEIAKAAIRLQRQQKAS